MLDVLTTYNMLQTLCTRAFEGGHVIWLYVFQKFIILMTDYSYFSIRATA